MMKKLFWLVLSTVILTGQSVFAQETNSETEAEWKSDFGVSLAFGKTYYLHKKPLLNMIKFGIDATWFDISYAKYSEPDAYANDGAYTRAYGDYGGYDYDDEEDIDLGIHQIDASMHVGPSITVNPIGDLKVAAYFHYVPTYSMYSFFLYKLILPRPAPTYP